jgi:cytoskeletal protein CcmA (bactofilin family)
MFELLKKNKVIMAKITDNEFGSHNLIAAGTVIKGNIESEGNIRIDGTVVGTVKCKGKLVIGNTGKIEGEIFCQNAVVSGDAKAKLTVTELLSLLSTAKLTGEIVAGKLSIEPGAIFTGTCSMGAVIKEITHGNHQKGEFSEERQQKKVGG